MATTLPLLQPYTPHTQPKQVAPTQPHGKAVSIARPPEPYPYPTKPTPHNTQGGGARQTAKEGYSVQENQSPKKIKRKNFPRGTLEICLCRGF